MNVSTLLTRYREHLIFFSIYFSYSLINVRQKIFATEVWFNGILERQHMLLMGGRYLNPEQSRFFQFLIPEFIHRTFELSLPYSYLLQRWSFTFLALCAFHVFLRKWFKSSLAFAGVSFFAAVMPFSYMNALQEAASLMILVFLLALWAIRERRHVLLAVILFFGAMNNESTLFLPLLFVFYNFRDFSPRGLFQLGWKTLAVSAPALLIGGFIIQLSWGRARTAPFWQLPDNLLGLVQAIITPPLEYWDNMHTFVFFLFGVFWVLAYLNFRAKPLFLRRMLLVAPLYFLANLIGGKIEEVRILLPLAFIIVPAAFFYLFPDEVLTDAEAAPVPESDTNAA